MEESQSHSSQKGASTANDSNPLEEDEVNSKPNNF